MSKTVLVVEDDPDIVKVLKVYLEQAGFQVEHVKDGEYGLTLALNQAIALIVLDWMLPGIDGLTFMKRLRARRSTPVVMLTARGEEGDRLEGFEVGVDDYIVKPFSPRELVARVKAVIARSSDRAPGERVLRFGALTIDPAARSVQLAERYLDLTTREFDLLLTLARRPLQVFTRDELLEQVWGSHYLGVDRVVDVHLSNLRAKLETDPPSPRYLETVRGVGYRFAVDEHNTAEHNTREHNTREYDR